MNSYEANKFFTDILAAWSFNKEPPAMEQNVWRKVLIGMDKEIAKQALEKCYRDYAHVKYFSLIKFLPTFKTAYQSLAPQRSVTNGRCPCCGNTGFIILKNAQEAETAYTCHCKGGQKSEIVCQNANCQNPEHLSRIKVLAGYHEKYPWQVAGYKNCKFKPVLSEVKNLDLPLTKETLKVLKTLIKAQMPIIRYIQKPIRDVKQLAGGDKLDEVPF